MPSSDINKAPIDMKHGILLTDQKSNTPTDPWSNSPPIQEDDWASRLQSMKYPVALKVKQRSEHITERLSCWIHL